MELWGVCNVACEELQTTDKAFFFCFVLPSVGAQLLSGIYIL